jgi:mannose-1-phosphate guanylyltransferase
MKVLILSGGGGERFWPLSRQSKPKQFLPIFSGKTLFEDALGRASDLQADVVVATNVKHQEWIQQFAPESFQILEPIGRNTAPAVALACLQFPNEVILVLPSDHLIRHRPGFHAAATRAIELAEEGFLVTFGLKPEYPETGYGYIEAIGELVSSFKEKPDLKTAESYVAQGNYFWNAGMFAFHAQTFIDECAVHAPELLEKAKTAFDNAEKNDQHLAPSEEDMRAIPSISIDYAVIEKTNRLRMVPAVMGWSDLGSFDALSEEYENNLLPLDVARFVQVNGDNNFAFAPGKVVATVGVSNLLIIQSDDAILVCHQGESQNVRQVMEDLKANAPEFTR